jgi:hypothetical protein
VPTENFSSVGVASWDIEKWVRKNSSLVSSSFLVALTVAYFHNQQKGYSFPTIERLSNESRVSEKTVKRAIKDMKDSGEWEILTGRGGPDGKRYGQARANRYYPTALLAGLVKPASQDDTVSALRDECSAILIGAGVSDEILRESLVQVWDVLPEEYQEQFLAQVASGEFQQFVDKTVERVADVLARGIDPVELVKDRLANSRTVPNIVISWLATWGLRPPNPKTTHPQRRGQYMKPTRDFTRSIMDSTPIDYGKTGQEI